jgi:tripartite-type tricarboxylate transporter receptor subunit TctC
VERLHQEIMKIMQTPDMQERLKGLGMLPSFMNPEQISKFQKDEIEKWAQVIKAANIKID